MTRVGVILLAIVLSLLVACEGRILSSRAMVVDLSVAQADVGEVAAVADDFFREEGFSLEGRDGYEELTDQHLVNGYMHPNGMLADVGLNNDVEVLIRIHVQTDQWDARANDLFEQFASVLESRWPEAVRKEPVRRRE